VKRAGVRAVVAAGVAGALVLSSCERENRGYGEEPAGSPADAASLTPLQPGPTIRVTAGRGPYDENAYKVNEGKFLYSAMNCVGCHANGGGGMGPALMDENWIYGSDPRQIFSSIAQGRPNGMPAWGTRLSNDQIWRLVGYVRSMSGQLRKDVAPTRSDDMFYGPSEQRAKELTPKNATGATER